MATTRLGGEAGAATEAAGRAEALDAPAILVCSWCRTEISRTSRHGRGAKNYGMCRGCLSHNLVRLESRPESRETGSWGASEARSTPGPASGGLGVG